MNHEALPLPLNHPAGFEVHGTVRNRTLSENIRSDVGAPSTKRGEAYPGEDGRLGRRVDRHAEDALLDHFDDVLLPEPEGHDGVSRGLALGPLSPLCSLSIAL